MVSMVLDKEPDVAVEVVKLLMNADEALTDEDCRSVYPLVYVSNRALAAAAGQFLYGRPAWKRLRGRSSRRPPPRGGGGGRGGPAAPLPSPGPRGRTSRRPPCLSRRGPWPLSGAGVPLSLPPGLGPGAQDAGRREDATHPLPHPGSAPAAGQGEGDPEPPCAGGGETGGPASTHRRRRPAVAPQFSADAEKAAPLLEILRYFDLSIYCTGRLEKHLELVLGQLREVVEKHSGRAVLEAAARALYALCDPELALHGRGDLVRGRLADQLVDKFHQEVAELLQASSLDEEEVYSMAATLKRISVLFNAHDLTPWQLFEPCTKLLQRAVDTGEVPPQVLVPAIACIHFHILWELSRLPNDGGAPQGQLRSLRSKVTSFCSLCQSCLSDVDPGIREQAFVVLSDLLLVFGPQLTRDGREALEPLVVLPDAGLQSQLAGFLMDHVFNHPEDSESHIEGLHRRRVLLAGFCKLIIYNVLELSAASDVFKHYAKFYSDYGDIIKETLNCTRQIDRQEWARTLLLSLQQLMTELLLQQGPEIRAAAAFLEIRDLARRFSLLFSLHQLRNRLALLNVEGIQFAFQEPPGPGSELQPLNLPFLEVLSEFSPRLLRPDKALILAYLDKTCQEQQWPVPDTPWPSLAAYRGSLQPQDDASSVGSRGSAPRRPPAKRRRLDGEGLRPGGDPPGRGTLARTLSWALPSGMGAAPSPSLPRWFGGSQRETGTGLGLPSAEVEGRLRGDKRGGVTSVPSPPRRSRGDGGGREGPSVPTVPPVPSPPLAAASSERTDSSLQLSSRLASPALTSTALRGSRRPAPPPPPRQDRGSDSDLAPRR
uniref:Cohesin subunit SCC3/SA HEAT-repeats domain-containing protein n=1 Tax=Apteryx owenii TaxID=8824 RepID=A0A8B9S3B5_APTOW